MFRWNNTRHVHAEKGRTGRRDTAQDQNGFVSDSDVVQSRDLFGLDGVTICWSRMEMLIFTMCFRHFLA